MSRILAVAAVAAAFAGGSLGAPATAAAEDEGTIYQRYADIRERLYSCLIQAEMNNQSDEDRFDCRRLQRRYVLYAWTGESHQLHVHCRDPRRCIPTPSSEPPANGPIPAGARVYDVNPGPEASKRKRKKSRRKKARSKRSRAARGSARATR